jgi:hypothetical protein
MTYVYIGSMTQLFESYTTKSFQSKQNFKPYLDSTLSGKKWTLRNRKSDHPVFVTLTSCLIFFYLYPLMTFSPFPCFKISWIFKSSNLAHVLFIFWNCRNRTIWNRKLEHPVFPALPNLVINTCPLHFS